MFSLPAIRHLMIYVAQTIPQQHGEKIGVARSFSRFNIFKTFQIKFDLNIWNILINLGGHKLILKSLITKVESLSFIFLLSHITSKLYIEQKNLRKSRID